MLSQIDNVAKGWDDVDVDRSMLVVELTRRVHKNSGMTCEITFILSKYYGVDSIATINRSE